MNIIAMAFISLGYALFYWGANELVHWNKSVVDTEAATMKLLFGFPMDASYQTLHPVPFPYQPADTASANNGGANSSPTPVPPGAGIDPKNGGLNPNFPGGPNSTIPTPHIPGTVTL